MSGAEKSAIQLRMFSNVSPRANDSVSSSSAIADDESVDLETGELRDLQFAYALLDSIKQNIFYIKNREKSKKSTKIIMVGFLAGIGGLLYDAYDGSLSPAGIGGICVMFSALCACICATQPSGCWSANESYKAKLITNSKTLLQRASNALHNKLAPFIKAEPAYKELRKTLDSHILTNLINARNDQFCSPSDESLANTLFECINKFQEVILAKIDVISAEDELKSQGYSSGMD